MVWPWTGGEPTELDLAKKELLEFEAKLKLKIKEIEVEQAKVAELRSQKQLAEVRYQEEIADLTAKHHHELLSLKRDYEEEIRQIEAKAKKDLEKEREKCDLLDARLVNETNEAKRKEAQSNRKIADLEDRNRTITIEAEIRRACNERLEKEKAFIVEQFKEHIANLQNAQSVNVSILGETIRSRDAEISRLNQSLEDLSLEFRSSKESFISYFKVKPKSDIQIPENLKASVDEAKNALNLDTVNFYNIAFVGHMCTGKSSLINALRGLKNDNKNDEAAKVGETETTMVIKPYTFLDPQLQHVKIYDVPGAGTISHDASSYYSDKRLCAFDCLIIVTQDSLGKDEIDFALKSLEYNQPIAFVRSRYDTVMDNAVKNNEIPKITQRTIVEYIKNSTAAFTKEMARTKQLENVPLFFVSSHSLRALMNNTKPDAVYQEKQMMQYIKEQSQQSRNLTD